MLFQGQNEYLLLKPGQDVFEGKWYFAENFTLPQDLEKIATYDKKWGKTLCPYEPTPGVLGPVWDYLYDTAVLLLFGQKKAEGQ